MTTQAEAMPLADYLVSKGVEPAQAATLGAEGDAISHNRGLGLRGEAHPAAQAELQAELHQLTPASAGEQALLSEHLERIYAPPHSPGDYRVPPPAGEPTVEAIAADVALTQVLHAERVPRDLGEAIMKDLNAARPSEKSAETVSALLPWVEQMMRTAKGIPNLRPLVEGVPAERFLHLLSPETIVALAPFVKHRAGRR